MIRYANISANLKEAMLKFCMEQSACVGFEEVKDWWIQLSLHSIESPKMV